METITIRVFDINELDELNNETYIISSYCIFYDDVVNKIIEVIAIYNRNFLSTKLLMHEETLGGAVEMDMTFWNELQTAIKQGEVVLLEGDESMVESLINLPVKIILPELQGVQ